MPIAPGRIKLQSPRRTFVSIGGTTEPGWELHFSIDGQGDYVAYVASGNLTEASIEAAIVAAATPWIAILDRYKQ